MRPGKATHEPDDVEGPGPEVEAVQERVRDGDDHDPQAIPAEPAGVEPPDVRDADVEVGEAEEENSRGVQDHARIAGGGMI